MQGIDFLTGIGDRIYLRRSVPLWDVPVPSTASSRAATRSTGVRTRHPDEPLLDSKETVEQRNMTALELHRQEPDLELAPILRVIKYMGLDSNDLDDGDVDRILKLYTHFERDPELVVGKERVTEATGVESDRLQELLGEHRHEIPFLGSATHPMVPRVALRMIKALANGGDPLAETDKRLYTLTEMAERTGISLASLSKYVKAHGDRIPSEMVGKMRKFPDEATPVFREIKKENLEKRGGRKRHSTGRHGVVHRRHARKLAALEQEVDAAVEASRGLSRTLRDLSRRVRRARMAAESKASRSASDDGRGAKRGSDGRPETIVAACRQVLGEAEQPMRVAEITDRVIALGAEIRAKNPNVTVSSILSSYDDFTRVKRGYYEMAS